MIIHHHDNSPGDNYYYDHLSGDYHDHDDVVRAGLPLLRQYFRLGALQRPPQSQPRGVYGPVSQGASYSYFFTFAPFISLFFLDT
jgi:hypothetical protein